MPFRNSRETAFNLEGLCAGERAGRGGAGEEPGASASANSPAVVAASLAGRCGPSGSRERCRAVSVSWPGPTKKLREQLELGASAVHAVCRPGEPEGVPPAVRILVTEGRKNGSCQSDVGGRAVAFGAGEVIQYGGELPPHVLAGTGKIGRGRPGRGGARGSGETQTAKLIRRLAGAARAVEEKLGRPRPGSGLRPDPCAGRQNQNVAG